MYTAKVSSEFNTPFGENQADLLSLKPTQLAVGLKEVKKKQKRLIKKMTVDPAALEQYLQDRPIVVVRGPENTLFVIDHHHLSLAVLRGGQRTTVPVHVACDFSDYSPKAFWQEMQRQQFVFPYDENGKRKPLTALPEDLTGLKDDPYRSLAWYVRKAGGYDKVDIPFAEFKWANYFRRHIEQDLLTNSFNEARTTALKLSQSGWAKNLPGYKKPATPPRSASTPS